MVLIPASTPLILKTSFILRVDVKKKRMDRGMKKRNEGDREAKEKKEENKQIKNTKNKKENSDLLS